MQNLGAVNAAQLMNHLKSLSFPCSKADIIGRLRDMGASQEQIDLLQKIADRQYGSPHEVMAEVKSFM